MLLAIKNLILLQFYIGNEIKKKSFDNHKKKNYTLKQNYTCFLQTSMFFKGPILNINYVSIGLK